MDRAELQTEPGQRLQQPVGRLQPTGQSSGGDHREAATTAAIERLEDAGYAVRTRDDADRRRVLVTTTPLAERHLEQVYGPVLPAGTALLSRYTRAELDTIHRFLVQGEQMQDQQADRIRSQTVK
ncbi:hypothetical protein GCM10029976_063800 [Kribbella albertanoniae]|uniref:hypothetical protein n=1 Tax=Kribbella albertanoniae TaxID=1266829 RepID=UPI00192D5724|nr:hypothetical protein [Kribbella albertanoniae]